MILGAIDKMDDERQFIDYITGRNTFSCPTPPSFGVIWTRGTASCARAACGSASSISRARTVAGGSARSCRLMSCGPCFGTLIPVSAPAVVAVRADVQSSSP